MSFLPAVISGSDRPYLYPWFRTARDGGAYLFEYGGQLVRISGADAVPLLSALLTHLDGSGTVEEIQRRLRDWDGAAIVQALSVLLSNGVITLTDISTSGGEEEHLLTTLLGPPATGRAIRQARVGVLGTGPLAQAVSALCAQAGVGHLSVPAANDEGADPLDLVVAAADGADLPRLEAWNREMLERGQPWLLVLPFDGVYGAVGPLFIPGETACYACLRSRRRSVLDDPAVAESYDERPAYHPMGVAVTSLMAGLAVHLALRWLTRRDACLAGILFAMALMPHPGVSAHEVFPVPRCTACRPMAQHTPAPWHPVDGPPDRRGT